MERPFDTRLRLVYETLEKTKENFIFNFNQNDKILVWIVGFSVTAISLIISKISDISENYSSCILKTVLLLLTTSIISGIIYRLSALLFLQKYQSIMFFLEGAFSKEKTMPTETQELKNPNDIHEIYQKIKTDFDHDYSDIIELYNQPQSAESKNYYVDYLKKEYERLAEWAKNEYIYADEYMKRVYKTAFGLSDKQINKLFSQNKDSFYLKMWSWICVISIAVCLITFVSVILILAMNYE
jgi:hypothetical protein